jgi:uncharacterized protein YaiL (DUF2058 family)
MSDSLRDQLLKAGFKPVPKVEAKPQSRPGKPQQPHKHGKPQTQGKPAAPREKGDIDLAKAYAIRGQQERDAKAREQREAEQRAKENESVATNSRRCSTALARTPLMPTSHAISRTTTRFAASTSRASSCRASMAVSSPSRNWRDVTCW